MKLLMIRMLILMFTVYKLLAGRESASSYQVKHSKLHNIRFALVKLIELYPQLFVFFHELTAAKQ